MMAKGKLKLLCLNLVGPDFGAALIQVPAQSDISVSLEEKVMPQLVSYTPEKPPSHLPKTLLFQVELNKSFIVITRWCIFLA